MSTKKPKSLLARGSIAAERALLDLLEGAISDQRGSGHLRRAAWIVVPTRVLRRHLQQKIVDRFGAVAGVSVWTLGGLVSRLSGGADVPGRTDFPTLEEPIDAQRSVAADDAAGGDDLLLEILAARHLAEVRGTSLERGRMPSAAIRDLLDAGIEIEHLQGLIENLADDEVSGGDIRRAGELLIAAGKTLEAIEEHDLRPARRRFALARQAIEDSQPVASGLRARAGATFTAPSAVFVYGFADLTGVGADFLQALANRLRATAVLNQPDAPDPATPIPAIERYLARWRSRLPPAEDAAPEPVEPARLSCFRAARPTAEIHEIGLRIRALIKAGAEPRTIGVVLRQPAVYGLTALRQLRRLGIPCSAPGLPGQLLPAGRRARALYDVLDQGESAPLSRWLDARHEDHGRDPVSGLPEFALRRRLALAGLRTLEQLADLNDDADGDDRDGPDSNGEAPKIDRSRVEEAQHLLELRDSWGNGDGRHHAERLGDFTSALLWPDDDPVLAELRERTERIGVSLSFEEFLLWLQRIGDEIGRSEPDPWELGGVRLLRIQDAREVTFEHLFVPGMSRGLFPRAIRGDSELREELREKLVAGGTGLLPDLPTASRFHDEEKYLFAQVLTSARRVTLSHAERSLDERLMPVSPVLSLLPADVLESIERPELAPDSGDFERRWRLLPPRDRQIFAGLWGRDLEGAPLDPARRAILDEHARSGPGPYLGWIGSTGKADDRRNRDLYVTTVERYAVCPWQTFVGKFLDVDERKDPDLVAPRLAPLAVGSLAHDLLAEIAERSGVASGGTWADLAGGTPRSLEWPDGDELRAMVEAAARSRTREDGIHLPGYAETLARAVEAVLARAREADLTGDRQILAVESYGSADLPEQSVRFKADRLEVVGGRRLATDYKTGKAKKGAVSTKVERAEWLQLPVYLLGGADDARLLWLGDPDHPAGSEARASAEDAEMLSAFEELATVLGRGWREGRFFPRVLDHNGGRPRACTWCDFTEACTERDPFARDRLQESMTAGDDPRAGAVWAVGQKRDKKRGSRG